jgi:hypothetical protein
MAKNELIDLNMILTTFGTQKAQFETEFTENFAQVTS